MVLRWGSFYKGNEAACSCNGCCSARNSRVAVEGGGKDYTVIACGLMVNEAMTAAETLAAEGIDIRIIDMHTIKPIDEEIIIKAAAETKGIVTAEEHSVIGGLGSAVAEVVCTKCPTKMAMVGVQDRFGQSGKPPLLMKEYNITAEDIVKAVKSL